MGLLHAKLPRTWINNHIIIAEHADFLVRDVQLRVQIFFLGCQGCPEWLRDMLDVMSHAYMYSGYVECSTLGQSCESFRVCTDATAYELALIWALNRKWGSLNKMHHTTPGGSVSTHVCFPSIVKITWTDTFDENKQDDLWQSWWCGRHQWHALRESNSKHVANEDINDRILKIINILDIHADALTLDKYNGLLHEAANLIEGRQENGDVSLPRFLVWMFDSCSILFSFFDCSLSSDRWR